MKTTVQIRDYFNENQTVGVSVTPVAIEGFEAQSQSGGYTHYATLTEIQIAKLKRELSNGPKGVNVTRQNREGKGIEAEIYFSL